MIKKTITGIIILASLLFAYHLLIQITNALRSSERLSQAADRVYQLEAKNRELKKKLLEVQSPQFVEEIARNKLNLGKEGETVVIIPEEKIELILGTSKEKEEERLPNWLGWWRVFFD